jgi:NAD(P)-dependent dehydrogenase (short-subunit alcohol dehydrogenase family)
MQRVLIDHPVPEVQAVLPSLLGRVAIVSGASSGLGKETVKWLALRGCDEVVLAVRNTKKAENVVEELVQEHGAQVPDLRERLVIMELDLASLASVKRFAAAYTAKHHQLDILVNNAGINKALGSSTLDGFELMWGTNHLGPTYLTSLLLPLLIAAPHRAVVSTCASAGVAQAPPGLVPETDEGLSQFGAYDRSKAANLVFTVELQRRLTAAGITHVRSVGSHPGWSYTSLVEEEPFYMRLLHYIFAQNVPMGTTPQLASIGAGLLASEDPQSGSKHNFFGPSRFFSLWGPPVEQVMFRQEEATDPELGKRVWELTNKQLDIEWKFE